MSNDLSGEYPGFKLECAEVCDARSVPRPDKSADVVLFMGPLYHIVEHDERISALKECYRVLKDDGLIFSAALTPYSVLLHLITVYRDERLNKSIALENPAVIKMIERELTDGCHINPERNILNGLGTSHLHTAKALKNELSEGGFTDTVVHGVMGGAWLVQNLDELWKDETSRNALMNTVHLLDTHEEVIGLSGHLLAISRKGNNL